MATIRIEDLSALEPLSPEQSEQVMGAGRGRRLGVEALEGRQVPAALSIANPALTANLSQINPADLKIDLTITGTESADVVNVTGAIGNLKVTRNGVTTSYNSLNIGRINFDGKGGNDTFVNDTSVPTLAHGGAGDDTLVGGSGADTLYGDDGKDTLDGRAGDDVLYAATEEGGFEGNQGKAPNAKGELEYYDQAHAYNTFVVNNLFGGPGDDVLHGSAFNDNMTGQGGSDWLFGYGGQDLLYGDGAGTATTGSPADVGGDDYLYGGTGVDALVGQQGNDHLYAGDQPGRAWWYVVKNDLAEPTSTVANTVNPMTGPKTYVQPVSIGDLLFGDEDRTDSANPTDGNDELVGDEGTDFLYGGGGDDVLQGGAGADVLHGGGGSDLISGNTLFFNGTHWSDPFAVDGAKDIDFLYGDSGDDFLFGCDGGIDELDAGGSKGDVIEADRTWVDLDGDNMDTVVDAHSQLDHVVNIGMATVYYRDFDGLSGR